MMPALLLRRQASQLCLWLHWLQAGCYALMHCSCLQVMQSVDNQVVVTIISRGVSVYSPAQHSCTLALRLLK